jgi:hypothetical protein
LIQIDSKKFSKRILIIFAVSLFFLVTFYYIKTELINGPKPPPLSGMLFFAGGGGDIYSLNLKNYSLKLLDNLKGGANINQVILSKPNELVLSSCDLKTKCNIFRLKLGSGQDQVIQIREGLHTEYVQESSKLFFYHPNGPKRWLWMVNGLEDKTPPKKISAQPFEIQDRLDHNLIGPPIKISSSKIVFVDFDKKLAIYDIKQDKKTSLDNSDCSPEVFVSGDEIICYGWPDGGYYFLNLKTLHRKKLDLPPRSHGLVYSPLDKVLFFGNTSFHFSNFEQHDIFGLWLETNSINKLVEDVWFTKGTWRDF